MRPKPTGREAAAGGYRGRLAPSPTGALHLGNARSFLAVWLRARQHGGALALRMEDIDSPRLKPGAAAQALADLAWLGLDWEEGPDRGGLHAPYTQSERRGLYEAALDRLIENGLAYACTCTRKEVEEAASAPHGPDGAVYPGTCRDRYASLAAARADAERPAAVRFRVDGVAQRAMTTSGEQGAERAVVEVVDGFAGTRSFAIDALGDFVIAKGDGTPAYQLACVVDDHAMGITEVVRADDLLPSAARQVLLYEALDLAPPAFVHLPLVVGPCGRRLAKRHGDTRIATLREAGVPAERLVGLLARWLGMDVAEGAEVTPKDLVQRFDLARVPPNPWVYDPRAVAAALGVAPSLLASP